MILGLGNDIIEISRIKQGYEVHSNSFLDRLFTPKEQEYFFAQRDPYPRMAGRFAAKEAIVKAFGCGIGHEIRWKDIEILPEINGKPQVHLSSELPEKFHMGTVLVTISHCKEYASAVAIWCKT